MPKSISPLCRNKRHFLCAGNHFGLEIDRKRKLTVTVDVTGNKGGLISDGLS